ncbi:MAG: PAS domain S-box protein [Rhodospirillaceae bacterium]
MLSVDTDGAPFEARALLANAPQAILIYNTENQAVVEASLGAEHLFGCSRDDLLRCDLSRFFSPSPDDAGPIEKVFPRQVSQALAAQNVVFERRMRRRDGAEFPCEVQLSGLPSPYNNLVRTSYIDISARKGFEARLRAAEARFQAIFQSLSDPVFVLDATTGRFLDVNVAGQNMFGYSSQEIIGRTIENLSSGLRPYAQPDGLDMLSRARNQGPQLFEWQCKSKAGNLFWAEISLRCVDFGDQPVGLAVLRDVTERHISIAKIREGRDKAQRYLDIAGVVILVLNAEGKVELINRRGCALLGYESAEEIVGRDWIDNFLPDRLRATLKGEFNTLVGGEGPQQYENPILTRHGDERIISWTNTVITDEQGLFLGTLSSGEDITERRRTELEKEAVSAQLERSLKKTVEALAGAFEMRDPYTAGHQRRVATLACAIALEMGLSKDRIEGLHVAGLMHDIGKIRIPAEILSHPGRLSTIEFELMKTHPQAGYDILKSIEFPWPVAEMVLQHHERLDGTGYPNRIAAPNIILEARILAVADVVEAMIAHRPYRPGLGQDAAFAELQRGRGTSYDVDVVEACKRVILSGTVQFG